MEEEIWKDITGYDKRYQVSSFGRVRKIKNDGTVRNLKTTVFGFGYAHLNLMLNGKQKSVQVHRLVAEAFVENPNNYPIVNHKDENKLNNHATNLEWCTYSYNINYGTRHERYRQTRKERNVTERFLRTMKERGRSCAEIPVVCLDKDLNIVAEYKSVAEGARTLGVCSGTIRHSIYLNMKKGKRWRSYGFLWVYKKNYINNKF